MKRSVFFAVLALLCLVSWGRAGGNLIINGDLEDPENPFKGWTIDFDWMGNHYNVDNTQHVSLVKQDGLKKNVLKLGKESGKETLFMSPLAPFEFGKRYRVSFDFRSKLGHSCRVYVRALKWKSGMKPYPNPHLGDLQLLYRGNAITCSGQKDGGSETGSRTSKSWQRVTTTFPFQDYSELSSGAKNALKYVRFIGLYCAVELVHSSDEEYFIDNVVIEEM